MLKEITVIILAIAVLGTAGFVIALNQKLIGGPEVKLEFGEKQGNLIFESNDKIQSRKEEGVKNGNTTPSLVPGSVLSVVALNDAKETYAGRNIRIRGKVQIVENHSEIQCKPEGPCNTLMGVNLYLTEPTPQQGKENNTPLYKDGKPYCSITGPSFSCAPFVSGEIIVAEGVFTKSKIPYKTISFSSGQKPKVIEWKDFYYLEVK